MSALPHSLTELLERLPELRQYHAPSCAEYAQMKALARTWIEERFAEGQEGPQDFGPFGPLDFPFHRMGAITSVDLFGLDELIIFSFYRANRARYHRVADVGGNIGLHALILNRVGFDVRCFEPDPRHAELLTRNLRANGCEAVELHRAAVSAEAGEQEFVRVLGNTTGSHLAGAKKNPYGELERFTVQVDSFAPVVQWADLIKMDVEGAEAAILTSTTPEDWTDADCMVEIGTEDNAKAVFDHFKDSPVTLFAQKTGWGAVRALPDMPVSYKEGSLFLSRKADMPW